MDVHSWAAGVLQVEANVFFQKQAITYRRDAGGLEKIKINKNRKNLIEIQKQLTMNRDTQ